MTYIATVQYIVTDSCIALQILRQDARCDARAEVEKHPPDVISLVPVQPSVPT